MHVSRLSDAGTPDLAPEMLRWLSLPANAIRYDRGRLSYRWPMRATVARLGRMPAPAGMPTWGEALGAILTASGDLGRAADALALRRPGMADPQAARDHLAKAVRMAALHYAKGPAGCSAAA
ncbi:MAG: hypothetical protein ACYDAN_02455 [Candidatus Limnocylindrales bacterium]